MDRGGLTEITAQNISTAFINTWVSRFRVSLHIITDRGSQFELELFSELSKIIGFHKLRTTLYHPQMNRLIEHTHTHTHRTLKTEIIARKKS